jgi:sodium transport system ATP-binding protein
MIEICQLNKTFRIKDGSEKRTVHAVSDVSFTAQNGRITGLLGANGAGKTTTLRIIAGLIPADSGTVTIDEIDMLANPSQGLRRLGMLSDARGLYPRLTASENILYYAQLHGIERVQAKARMMQWAKLFGLSPLLDRRSEGFSLGERMKTALARALIHDPANIILDEPTNGLDVVSIRALRESLMLLREQGRCIVVSTHIMQEVERLCDEVVVMAQGQSVAQGSVEQLLAKAKTNDFEEAFVRLAFPVGLAATRAELSNNAQVTGNEKVQH